MNRRPLNDLFTVCTRSAVRFLREPTIVFFIIGAAIFLVHRVVAGDPRTIVVTTAVRADLTRRFKDQLGRQPSGAELDRALQSWKQEEVLYREALRQGMDREDPFVRTRLVERVRERLSREFPVAEPSPLDLEHWLAQHRSLYEMPFIYEHEYITFPKGDPDAERKRAKYERELNRGASPTSLHLRTSAANVSRERIQEEFGSEVASKVCGLPVGEWHPFETQNTLLLVRMIHIEGGLPQPEVLRERLIMDWKSTMQRQAVERATQAIAGHYRFQERH